MIAARSSFGSSRQGVVIFALKCLASASSVCAYKGEGPLAQGATAPSLSDLVVSGTTSAASNLSCTPRPSQVGQAPAGLLNEKSLGSISGIVKPDTGHANFWLKMMRC